MPVKWKIFMVLNFIVSLPALLCFILMFINLFNTHQGDSGREFLFIFLPLFCMLMIALNGLLNIYVLQRYFPDKLLPGAIRRLNVLCLIVNFLVSVVILIFCFYAATFEFSSYNGEQDQQGKIALVILFFLWLVQVVVLIMQTRLPGIINRNNRKKMDSLIDSIGQ